MRECENADVRDLLPLLAHGTLAGADRARAESHVATCAACREELALLRAVRGALPLPAVHVARIAAAVAASRDGTTAAPGVVSLAAHRAERARRRGFAWGRAAAVAAVLVGAVGVTLRVERGTGETPAAATGAAAPIAAAPDAGAETATAAVSAEPQAPRAAVTTPRVAQLDGTGSLGGVVSDVSDDELAALIAGLESLSGVPEVDEAEAGEAEGGDA